MSDEIVISDEAVKMLNLWLGPPQDRAQVMPKLAELNRFHAILVVVYMIEGLQNAPQGDRSIPLLLKSLEESAWRYST